MEHPSTTPPWYFRCCILATTLWVWPVVIWLHSVSHLLNTHAYMHARTHGGALQHLSECTNRLSCPTISRDHALHPLPPPWPYQHPHRVLRQLVTDRGQFIFTLVWVYIFTFNLPWSTFPPHTCTHTMWSYRKLISILSITCKLLHPIDIILCSSIFIWN